MNIQTLIAENPQVNIIESYLCPDARDCLRVGWDRNVPFTINHGTGATTQVVKEYHHRDMTYVYDLDSDGQRAVRRLAQKDDKTTRAIYTVAFIEECIPAHRFPSTKDIAHTEVIQRRLYRLNNRMHFVHDEDESGLHYYYFRYQHADNVDVKKMQSDFDRAFRCVRSQFR
jgi:hypothetical protein